MFDTADHDHGTAANEAIEASQVSLTILADPANLITGENLVLNDVAQARVFDTPAGIAGFIKAFFVLGFPDARVELRSWKLYSAGFTLQTRLAGCQKGPLMGIPATGRQVTLDVTLRGRLEAGRLRYLEFDYKPEDLLRQLGLAL